MDVLKGSKHLYSTFGLCIYVYMCFLDLLRVEALVCAMPCQSYQVSVLVYDLRRQQRQKPITRMYRV